MDSPLHEERPANGWTHLIRTRSRGPTARSPLTEPMLVPPSSTWPRRFGAAGYAQPTAQYAWTIDRRRRAPSDCWRAPPNRKGSEPSRLEFIAMICERSAPDWLRRRPPALFGNVTLQPDAPTPHVQIRKRCRTICSSLCTQGLGPSRNDPVAGRIRALMPEPSFRAAEWASRSLLGLMRQQHRHLKVGAIDIARSAA